MSRVAANFEHWRPDISTPSLTSWNLVVDSVDVEIHPEEAVEVRAPLHSTVLPSCAVTGRLNGCGLVSVK